VGVRGDCRSISHSVMTLNTATALGVSGGVMPEPGGCHLREG
jgi:hypothetical protein